MTAPAALWAGEETLVPAALRGYRSWNVVGGVLCSTGVEHRWDEPQASARCLAGSTIGGGDSDCDCDLCVHNQHRAPVRDCTCGIYGWYDPDDSRLAKGDVFGAVEITGRAVMASHGFRAERARILALAIEAPAPRRISAWAMMPDRMPATTAELHDIARWAKTQGIPVFATRAAMLAEFPPQDVSSLVKHDCEASCTAHRNHESEYARASRYANSWIGTVSMSTGANSLAYATARNAYTTTREPQPPKCHLSKYVCLGLLALSVVGIILGLVSLIGHGIAFPSTVGILTNGGLVGYWGKHAREKHWPIRTKKTATNLNSVESEDDVEDDDA